jgi:CRP-like cAMP-binding protein
MIPVETTPLRKFISSVYPLKETEMERFLESWQAFTCKRKTILTAAGETERYLYFVLEGVQRAFFVGNGERQEATIVFTYPPSFSGVADSFLTQTPSKYFLETLTNGRFLKISYQKLNDLMSEFPVIQRMVLQLSAIALKGVLERQFELQCFSAEERFKTLMARSPHLLQIIPHKYLASYLGIDPTTFSKLLGSVRI